MLWRVKVACLLAALGLIIACSKPPVPMPTSTPYPSPITTVSCPAGYELHVDRQMGFSACYPADWVIVNGRGEGNALRWMGFASPGSDLKTGEELRLVVVKVSPPMIEPGAGFLEAIEELLSAEYGQRLLGSPYRILVDGREAVEVSYIELPAVFEGGPLKLGGWTATFLADGKQWVIEVFGRSGYRTELVGIHGQFLAHFQVLAPQL